MSQETVVVQEVVAPVEEVVQVTPEKASPEPQVCSGRCHCDNCRRDIEIKFLPFDIAHWSRQADVVRPCPRCERPIRPQGRGGFLVWNCWECTAQRATISAVFDNSDRSYGFAIKDGDGAVVYFHFSRFNNVQCDGFDYPVLAGLSETDIPVVPQVGDRIIYHEMPGEKTVKALWWAFESAYKKAIVEIEDRPVIRFVFRDGRPAISRLHEKPKISVRWEGKNLAELRQRFPQNEMPAFDRGHTAKYFEAQNDHTGEWERIDDPR